MATPFDPTKPATRPRSHKLDPTSIHEFIEDLIGEDLHAQRVRSVANGVIGVLHAATLAIHAIGEGLAVAMGLDPKHAIKQVDRLLSNRGVDVEVLAPLWVSFVPGALADFAHRTNPRHDQHHDSSAIHQAIAPSTFSAAT